MARYDDLDSETSRLSARRSRLPINPTVMATSAEMRDDERTDEYMDRVMESKSEVVISSHFLVPGSTGVQAFGD
jgi:hypothetical protein